jgi:pyrrolysine biosynthesis protein PylD
MAISSSTVAVVPVTSGCGVIEGFGEAIEAITNHIGGNAFKTEANDVTGLAEGIQKGADIVFLADDKSFVALDLAARRVIDNAEATAKGYTTALECMAGGLRHREVLVIGGAGRVGWNAVLSLVRKGARVAAFDLNQDKMGSLARRHEITVERDLELALGRYTILFDASPATNIIRAEHIKPDTIVAAPGMPLGLCGEAYLLVKERLVHDVLEIGVATMLIQASCP